MYICTVTSFLRLSRTQESRLQVPAWEVFPVLVYVWSCWQVCFKKTHQNKLIGLLFRELRCASSLRVETENHKLESMVMKENIPHTKTTSYNTQYNIKVFHLCVCWKLLEGERILERTANSDLLEGPLQSCSRLGVPWTRVELPQLEAVDQVDQNYGEIFFEHGCTCTKYLV